MRKIHQNVPRRFEPTEWTVEETSFSEDAIKVTETVFALGNGYLGVRGVFDEGFYGFVGNTIPGTVINGVYEYHDYHHIWCRPGFPPRYHSIMNQIEAFQTGIFCNGEPVRMLPEQTSEYRRVLDMRRALLSRTYTYKTKDGVRLCLSFERFVSMAEKHTAASRISVTADRNCRLRFVCVLDGEIKSTGLRNDTWG